MAGNIGKLTFWKPINMADPKQAKENPGRAVLQVGRDKWLVFRNAHLTLASAKVAAPKDNKGFSPSAHAVKGCLSALSERFNHKDQSRNQAAQKGALETIDHYFSSNDPDFRRYYC